MSRSHFPPESTISRQAPSPTVPQLVGQVYQAVPPFQQLQLIDRLMQPLGLLAIAGVAHGVFAKVWFHKAVGNLAQRFDDLRTVSPVDVEALARFVDQVSAEAIDGLAQMAASWPGLAGSAAVALLVTTLARRSGLRGIAGQKRP